jgi:hypothetical protein
MPNLSEFFESLSNFVHAVRLFDRRPSSEYMPLICLAEDVRNKAAREQGILLRASRPDDSIIGRVRSSGKGLANA